MTNILTDIQTIASIDAVPSILEVICKSTGMGFAAVARVTDEKWVACAVRDEIQFGLIPGGELVLESTICHEIRQHQKPVIIDKVSEDPDYAAHHTPLQYGFQSYISVPIFLNDGTFFGTLCAIDPSPAKLKDTEIPVMFSLFAEMLAMHIHSADALRSSQLRLEEELQTSKLREEFIAILGHDLRNPVSAISNVGQLMARMPLDERMTKLTRILQDSTLRMKGLIDNMLDFARGHLGDGIKLKYRKDVPLQDLITKVITETRMTNPSKEIVTRFQLGVPVECDGNRIAQLFSNLLSNAISHGHKDTPVIVTAASDGDQMSLSVVNEGEPIAREQIGDMFKAFAQGKRQNKDGLGLGLYISAEIAKAHKGSLEVLPEGSRIEFRLTIPSSALADGEERPG